MGRHGLRQLGAFVLACGVYFGGIPHMFFHGLSGTGADDFAAFADEAVLAWLLLAVVYVTWRQFTPVVVGEFGRPLIIPKSSAAVCGNLRTRSENERGRGRMHGQSRTSADRDPRGTLHSLDDGDPDTVSGLSRSERRLSDALRAGQHGWKRTPDGCKVQSGRMVLLSQGHQTGSARLGGLGRPHCGLGRDRRSAVVRRISPS